MTATAETRIKEHVDNRFDQLEKLIVGTHVVREGDPVEAAEAILADEVSPLERP